MYNFRHELGSLEIPFELHPAPVPSWIRDQFVMTRFEGEGYEVEEVPKGWTFLDSPPAINLTIDSKTHTLKINNYLPAITGCIVVHSTPGKGHPLYAQKNFDKADDYPGYSVAYLFLDGKLVGSKVLHSCENWVYKNMVE